MPKTAWVVDDDDEIRNAMKSMLQLMGYEFRGFMEPRSAGRALLDFETPDLMFLDINMPKVTGLQFLEFVRSREQWKKLPVLMVTSESSEITVEEAIRLGADGYVFKPVNFDELQMAIETAIERRRIAVGNAD